jgi:hypothetical protein
MATPPPDFDPTPAFDAELARAAIALTAARRAVALTGAGLEPLLELVLEAGGAVT